MKALLILPCLIIISNSNFAQCNIKVNKRPDGITIRYMNPEMVGKGRNCELGFSVSTNGEDYLLNATVLYFSNVKKIKNELVIALSNNKSLNLELFSNELAVMNNNQVSLALYILTKEQIQELKTSSINNIIFQEIDGVYQVIKPQNQMVVSKQLKCLLN